VPDQPPEKHRAWAEMVRTAAAVATLLLTIGLFLDKLGVW
jgi:hypothetical protein